MIRFDAVTKRRAEGRAARQLDRADAVERRGQGRRRLQPADDRSIRDHRPQRARRGVRDITLGGPPEFADRSPFGIPGFKQFYNAEFKRFVPLEIGPPIYDALNANQINCANVFSTDAAISQNDWTPLTDDKNIVPAEAVVPLISVEKATPEVSAVLDSVSAALDTEGLTALNPQVQGEGLAGSEVAAQWLTDNGFTD